MESSQVSGATEDYTEDYIEESGWTAYIGSPSQEDEEGYYDDGEDSDDSMASDASSGPNQHFVSSETTAPLKYEDEVDEKYKGFVHQKPVGKKKEQEIRTGRKEGGEGEEEDTQDFVFLAERFGSSQQAAHSVCGSTKFRNINTRTKNRMN